MKSVFAIVLGTALLAAPGSARAQSGPVIELSPFAGGMFFLHDGPSSVALERPTADPQIVEDARFEDTWSAGLSAGVRLNDHLAVEGLFTWTPTWLIGTNFSDGTDVYSYLYAVSAVLHPPVPGRLRPFVGLGLGGELDDYSESIHSHAHWMTTFQGGLTYDLGDGRSLRIEGRDFLAPFDSMVPGVRAGWQNDLMFSAGVSWRISSHRERARDVGDWHDFDPREPLP